MKGFFTSLAYFDDLSIADDWLCSGSLLHLCFSLLVLFGEAVNPGFLHCTTDTKLYLFQTRGKSKTNKYNSISRLVDFWSFFCQLSYTYIVFLPSSVDSSETFVWRTITSSSTFLMVTTVVNVVVVPDVLVYYKTGGIFPHL